MHFENRVFTDAPFVPAKLVIMCLFPRVTTYFASLLLNCPKVATHVQDESISGRLGCCGSDKASNYILLKGYYQFCKLTLYRVAFVSRLGCAMLVFARILCSTRVCMLYVHGRHVWVRGAGAWQQTILRVVMCSRSSVVPVCGVLTA